jgi:hypothetical protein
MVSLDYLYKKFVNLGVFSRGLLVIVKPLALWLSIKFDSDAGLALAQIYLIGLLIVSLSGTNAHRSFYQLYFAVEEQNHSKNVARSYISYIQKLTLQLMFVFIVSVLVASVVFWGSFNIVMMGIIYGIAEKLNDEFQRYTQFRNNSKNLFYLALSKLIPILIAASLSYAVIIDIRFSFPVLLLAGSIFVNLPTIYLAICYLTKSARKSFFVTIKRSCDYIREDILQIGCVFIGISLISLDKWLIQYFSPSELPMYMLYTQIASVFIVIQTIILIAPVRARLVNENPQEIKVIKIGSPIISIIPFLLGIALYYYNDVKEDNGNIGYFAFFFAAIVTFTVAYAERLYWVISTPVRLALDVVIAITFILLFVVLTIFWPSNNSIVYSLVLLFCLMCIRLIVIMYLLNKTKVYKI